MASRHDSALEKGIKDKEIGPNHAANNDEGFSVIRVLKQLLGRSRAAPIAPSGPRKLRPTAYLDGLRGFAAFMVYIHHHQLWAHEPFGEGSIFELPYGYNGIHEIAAFPIIRNFFGGGHYAVAIFFVLSGYVLSLKPLSLAHQGEIEKFGENLGSALFRRWVRLYIPVIATTFCFFTSWYALNMWVPSQAPKGSWFAELSNWFTEFLAFSYIFRPRGEPWFVYNMHVWSIPVEFVGSICVYVTLLAFATSSKMARLTGVFILTFCSIYMSDGWFTGLFLVGILLCDLDHLRREKELPWFFYRLEPYRMYFFYFFLVMGLYLGGVPSHTPHHDDLAKYEGWYYLSKLNPRVNLDYKWHYLFHAAWMTVVASGYVPWLRRFFETRFCQYLGRISFSLYLIHGPVIWTLGHRMYVAVGMSRAVDEGHTPNWSQKFILPRGPIGLEVAILVPQIILLPLTFALSELSTRWFDEPSVKIAQWMYQQTLATPQQRPARKPVQ